MKLQSIRKQGQLGVFVVDLVMVVLLVINLAWIVFDWLLQHAAIFDLFVGVWPEFASWYAAVIQPRFIFVDLMFVSIFLLEFFARWVLAVTYRRYHRWFFFPFIHWYDLLGCIPIAGFRILRLLRIISIAFRLHRTGVIDLSQAPAVRFVRKYYGIAMQELTDRVTVNLLSEIQDELRHGTPVLDKIMTEVVAPQREALVEWLSHRIERAATRHYQRHRADIRRYIRSKIRVATERNREVARLDQLPMVGPMVRRAVEDTASDVAFNLVTELIQDLGSERNRIVVEEAADLLFEAIVSREEDTEVSAQVLSSIDRSLELIKHHVRIQQWKLREQSSDESEFRRLMREELDRIAEEWDKEEWSDEAWDSTEHSTRDEQTTGPAPREEPNAGANQDSTG